VSFVLKAEEEEQCLFTTFLISATMQDEGKREKSNDYIYLEAYNMKK